MGIVQIAQRVLDLTRATEFYKRLLGQASAATFDPPGLAFFVIGETRLLLDVNAPSALVYFAVEDIHGRIDELRADGVTILQEPSVIFHHDTDALGPAGSDEWMAFIEDSEGNTVGLVTHTPSPD